MGVPRELIGAWRRSGLIIDGLRQVDHCDVLWLQGAEWYVDIRLRISRPELLSGGDVAVRFARERAFAGTASWREPMLTWELTHPTEQKQQTRVTQTLARPYDQTPKPARRASSCTTAPGRSSRGAILCRRCRCSRP